MSEEGDNEPEPEEELSEWEKKEKEEDPVAMQKEIMKFAREQMDSLRQQKTSPLPAFHMPSAKSNKLWSEMADLDADEYNVLSLVKAMILARLVVEKPTDMVDRACEIIKATKQKFAEEKKRISDELAKEDAANPHPMSVVRPPRRRLE